MPTAAFCESLNLRELSRKKPESVKVSGGTYTCLPQGQPGKGSTLATSNLAISSHTR